MIYVCIINTNYYHLSIYMKFMNDIKGEHVLICCGILMLSCIYFGKNTRICDDIDLHVDEQIVYKWDKWDY